MGSRLITGVKESRRQGVLCGKIRWQLLTRPRVSGRKACMKPSARRQTKKERPKVVAVEVA